MEYPDQEKFHHSYMVHVLVSYSRRNGTLKEYPIEPERVPSYFQMEDIQYPSTIPAMRLAEIEIHL